jgi:DNA-binding transcriptional regulator PaaX
MNTRRPIEDKYPSTILYILAALVPYTEPNLKLSFKPSQFFNDLERLSKNGVKAGTIRTTYHRALKQGLVKLDGNIPRLTEKGRHKIKPYHAKKLKGAQLMITFDIPEKERQKRTHLRLLLKELSFKQVQKSVWMSQNDHRKYLAAEINAHKLEKYVEIFEARSVKV